MYVESDSASESEQLILRGRAQAGMIYDIITATIY